MEQSDEIKKQQILEYLKTEFKNKPTGMTADEVIAEKCNLDKTEVKGLCILLQQDELIDYIDAAGTFHFYRINSSGMRYLEKYSQTAVPRPGLSPPLMKDILARSLAVFESMKHDLIENLIQVAQDHSLNNGVYYIVLVDLSKSTVAASRMSGVQYSQWLDDFTKIVKESLNFPHKNIATYIDTSGDGSLFLFGNFYEILEWKNKVNNMCVEYNTKNMNKPNFHPYNTKTIVHLGEVYLDKDTNDTKSFAVNVVFKIEKKFDSGDFGITDAVRQAIVSEINAKIFQVTRIEDYSPDDGGIIIPLWKLSEISSDKTM